MFTVYHPQPFINVGTSGAQAQNAAVGGASASIAVAPGINKVYRVVSTTDTYLRFSKGATATATTGDMILPLGRPMYLKADKWDTINFLQVSAGGFISIVQVQNTL